MNPKWQLRGRIPPGGIVLHLARSEDETLWAASPAGLFARRAATWRPVTRGFPFGSTSTILAIQDSIFVAGLPHGLVRSTDQGKTWHTCWTEQTEAPITCLLASPNFNRDRVVLAGTDGDGILRSTDGGRYWHLENFGLRSFSVLSMATAPTWGRHEVLFAGTDAGFFQSPNGGRAWRQLGEELGDKKVTALLVSPSFTDDKTLFAGTEGHGLYQSTDGGWRWKPFPLDPFCLESINCLALAGQDHLLVGTGTDGILHVKMDGTTWKASSPNSSPVLCLLDADDQFFAGISEGGLLSSSDGGETWTSDPGLNARRFNQLAITDEDTLLAAGVTEGLWISRDAGTHWEKTTTGHEDLIPLDVAVSPPTCWVGASTGIWVSRDGGIHWEHTFASETPISAIACTEGRAWAGNDSGQILMTEDGGTTWQPMDIPIGTSGILALAASPYYGDDQTLVAAEATVPRNRLQLWRSTDAGAQWHLWLDEKTDWQAVRLSLNGIAGQETVLGLGTHIMSQVGGKWKAREITTAEAPISAILALPDLPLIIVAVADDILVSNDGENWQKFAEGLDGVSIVALQQSQDFPRDRTVWGLSSEGEVWKRVLA